MAHRLRRRLAVMRSAGEDTSSHELPGYDDDAARLFRRSSENAPAAFVKHVLGPGARHFGRHGDGNQTAEARRGVADRRQDGVSGGRLRLPRRAVRGARLARRKRQRRPPAGDLPTCSAARHTCRRINCCWPCIEEEPRATRMKRSRCCATSPGASSADSPTARSGTPQKQSGLSHPSVPTRTATEWSACCWSMSRRTNVGSAGSGKPDGRASFCLRRFLRTCAAPVRTRKCRDWKADSESRKAVRSRLQSIRWSHPSTGARWTQ